jgi:hypothetical protein
MFIYTVKPAYNGTTSNQKFFFVAVKPRFLQVFEVLIPRDCRGFRLREVALMSRFRLRQVLLN